MAITPDDEQRYKLPPLPDPPFFGVKEAQRLNRKYERDRIKYRKKNPHVTRVDIESGARRPVYVKLARQIFWEHLMKFFGR